MVIDILYLLLKILGVILLILLARAIQKHLKI